VDLVEQALRARVGADHYVRGQKPLALDANSEPEPDVAVVRGGPRDYVDQHPTTAALTVEVADTSLSFDRGRKAAAYARNGIPEYWVLNLRDRLLHVHRVPEGGVYRDVTDLDSDASLAPLVSPDRPIRISDLLP
jgi:Uma2 family endonuclease